MYGIVTRNAEELEWEEFETGFYEVKEVSGRQTDPVSTGANMVSCHADTAASEESDLVPVDDAGRPATRDREAFDWGYVCPTHEGYRAGLLEIIERCGEVNQDVRLDDVGFPSDEYCHCDRCTTQFEESEYTDRTEWRAAVIADFIADARDRVPGTLYLALYPDPYPGHLRKRTGIDVDLIDQYVDEYIIPIYDMAYTTTYWLEILASGFADTLDTPFSVELYAVQVKAGRLTDATVAASTESKHVLFGYDAGTARGVIRRLQAEQAEGTTYG